jgi:hypothetical protein
MVFSWCNHFSNFKIKHSLKKKKILHRVLPHCLNNLSLSHIMGVKRTTKISFTCILTTNVWSHRSRRFSLSSKSTGVSWYLILLKPTIHISILTMNRDKFDYYLRQSYKLSWVQASCWSAFLQPKLLITLLPKNSFFGPTFFDKPKTNRNYNK